MKKFLSFSSLDRVTGKHREPPKNESQKRKSENESLNSCKYTEVINLFEDDKLIRFNEFELKKVIPTNKDKHSIFVNIVDITTLIKTH